MRRWGSLFLGVVFGLLEAGCPKGQPDFNQGKKAETLQDYDAAFAYYEKAAKKNPYNSEYKIKLNRVRFEASERHVKHGVELRRQGDLQGAAAEFQRAQTIDPSSPVADQELRSTVEMIAEKNRAADEAAESPANPNEPALASMPPELKPLSRAPINLKMSNDARIVFDTVGKLAGLTVVYDPDFPARRITVELNNVTMEQALEIVSLESKAFVKPVTENIIFVIPDQPQKRRDYEEQVVKTFYLSNTLQPTDLREIVTARAVLTDSEHKIIQNPEGRSVDGQTAKLRIGDRIPIATGSFSSGIGGVAGGVAGGISPLVNTQFTYLDVGVNIDLTPRVHPNRDVSLKLKVEVSAHTSDVSIGGITQPVISQRVIEDDIRLKEGEVNIVGGLVQRTESKTLEGWPGLAKLPLLRYLFSHDKTAKQEDEVLIVLTPRIVRIPEWTKANLRPMYSGSETNVQVKRESEVRAPVLQPPAIEKPAQTPAPDQNMGSQSPSPAPEATKPAAGTVPGAPEAKIRFEPQSLTLKAGQTATIG